MFVLSKQRHVCLPMLALIFCMTILAQQDNQNPAGTGCVDPKGFLECYSEQSKQLTSCAQVANSTCADTNTHLQTCLSGCSGHHLASKIGCWLQSCWNQVYSCEYQMTAAEYIVGVALVQSTVNIPFYPPPDGDQPGGCSCNIGNVVGNLSSTPKYHCVDAAQNTAPGVFAECTCCQHAFPFSNAINACPKSALSVFSIKDGLRDVQAKISERTPDQCAVLNSDMESAKYCADTYGVVEYAGPKVYNPLNLPDGVPGSEPTSNLPGTPFTTFASVLTLALVPGYSSVITPVAYKAGQTGKTEKTAAATTSDSKDAASRTANTGSATGAVASASKSATGAGIRLSIFTPEWMTVWVAALAWVCLS